MQSLLRRKKESMPDSPLLTTGSHHSTLNTHGLRTNVYSHPAFAPGSAIHSSTFMKFLTKFTVQIDQGTCPNHTARKEVVEKLSLESGLIPHQSTSKSSLLKSGQWHSLSRSVGSTEFKGHDWNFMSNYLSV